MDAEPLGDILITPSPRISNCLPLASVQVDDEAYIFYYDDNDSLLHMASGKENTGWPTTPIQIGGHTFKINNPALPMPLAAGYDSTKKEIHVFFVDSRRRNSMIQHI
ncbi:MAG: hypothetical protein M1822_009965 [Bathelium mastoideum]|nr:MAG: hypothetical protein M1822_009965 [Bathelium mastoideum]